MFVTIICVLLFCCANGGKIFAPILFAAYIFWKFWPSTPSIPSDPIEKRKYYNKHLRKKGEKEVYVPETKEEIEAFKKHNPL